MKPIYEVALRLESGAKNIVPGYFKVLRAAHVIDINDACVRVGQRLIGENGVRKLSPFLRLPYPIVFLQWDTRALAKDAPLEGMYIPKQEAALIMRGDVLAEWQGLSAHRDTSGLKDGYVVTPIIASQATSFAYPHFESYLLSKESLGSLPRTAAAAFYPVPSPFWTVKSPLTPQELRDNAAPELILSSGFLALMNCPNLAQITDRGTTHRRKTFRGNVGDEVIRRHKLSIRISRVQQRRSGAAGSSDALRLHTVRGHFKVRKSGIYWWSDFMRGDANLGSVTKAYSLSK